MKDEDHLLKDEDLKHLWQLVEKRDGGPPWKHMMDRSTPQMTFQAWQRDREVTSFLASCKSKFVNFRVYFLQGVGIAYLVIFRVHKQF